MTERLNGLADSIGFDEPLTSHGGYWGISRAGNFPSLPRAAGPCYYSIPKPYTDTELRRFESQRRGRPIPQVLSITADEWAVFQYETERLWFVALGGKTFAVMERTSDDAWMAVDEAIAVSA